MVDASRPAVAPALRAAADEFSLVWYARRPAGPGEDAAMRRHTDAARVALAQYPAVHR